MYVSHNVKLNIVKKNVFVTCGNNVMNSVQNQKSVGNTKLEQSKQRPLKNIEVPLRSVHHLPYVLKGVMK